MIYIDLGTSQDLKHPNEMTVSVWLKGTGSNINSAGVGNLGNSGQRGWHLGITSTNGLYWLIPISATGFVFCAILNDPTKWTHYVGTAKVGKKGKLYKDGILVAETAVVTSLYGGNPLPTTIGSNRGSYFVNGSMDEVKIFNKAYDNLIDVNLLRIGQNPR